MGLVKVPSVDKSDILPLKDPNLPVEVGEGAAPVQINDSRYCQVGTLGEGGGNVVYESVDLTLGRTVVMKQTQGQADERSSAGLMAEARLTASLEHANILPVFDGGVSADGHSFFTMRKARGLNLGEALKLVEAGRPPAELIGIENLLTVFLKAADAVAYAHSRKVVHRDLKPENILIGEFGEVTVVDWGVARHHANTDVGGGAGRVVGTPEYCSPEQARGEPADERSDVWCLGATLFRMVYGRLPMWEDDTDQFWLRKRSGDITPPDDAEMTIHGAYLAIVILCALQPDPDARHQSVTEFQESIRGWLEHRASTFCSDQATADLFRASAAADLEGILLARHDFVKAMNLWPGNPQAELGRQRATQVAVEVAMIKGDLVGAERLIDSNDSEHDYLTRLLAAAKVIQGRAHRRQRLVQGFMCFVLAAALLLLALLGREYWLQSGRWQSVFDVDMDRPGKVVTMQSNTSLAFGLTASGEVELKSQPDGVCLPGFTPLWLPEVNVPGDVRLHVEVTWVEQVDGLELAINGRLKAVSDPSLPPRAFSCQFGGYMGTQEILSYQNEDDRLNFDCTADSRLQAGRRYRLTFSRVDDRLAMEVDGREVLSRRVLIPVSGPDQRRLMLRSWGTVRLHRITVERMASPQQLNIVNFGDRVLGQDPVQAVEAWLSAVEDHPGTALAEKGLARAARTAFHLGPSWSATAVALGQRLLQDFPDSPFLEDLTAAQAVVAWRAGQQTAALYLISREQTRNPRSQVLLSLLGEEHHRLGDTEGRRLVALAAASSLTRIDLSGYDLDDLSPLTGRPLSVLVLGGNPRLSSLAPLRGMPLRMLNLSNDKNIHDLTSLAGMPLEVLTLDDTNVSDISPLAGMPLRRLSLVNTPVSNLTALRGMSLSHLELGGSAVTSIEPLAGMRLQRLGIATLPITSIEALRGAPLSILNANRTLIEDLSPLRLARLEVLELADCPRIRDLSPIVGQPLSYVNVSVTPVSDLLPLAGSKLERLYLRGSSVASLAPLRGVTIRDLNIECTSISDLSPLFGCGLTDFSAFHTPITDLSPLSGMKLRQVNIAYTGIQDISPLYSGGVKCLDAGGNGTLILGRFLDSPPPIIMVDAPGFPQQWRKRPDMARLAALADLRQAFQQGDAATLLASAVPVGGRRMVAIDLSLTWGEAQAGAARVGARPARLTSAEERNLVRIRVCANPMREIGNVWCGDPGPRGDGASEESVLRIIPNRTPAPVAWTLVYGLLNREAALVYATELDYTSGVLLEWPGDANHWNP